MRGSFLCGVAAVLFLGSVSSAAFTAYNVPQNTAGNQGHPGWLSLDFNVNSPIEITQIGVFDDGSNGLVAPITFTLFDRATQAAVGASVDTIQFTTANSTLGAGTGFRFMTLSTPLQLSAGFQGRVAAGGYSHGDSNGNDSGGPTRFVTGDSGGGLITFVSPAHWLADISSYPVNNDNNAFQYGGPTFIFQATTAPEPGTMGLLGVASLGLLGRRRRHV